MPELIYIDEPSLLFNYDQPMLDPRDGLTLFGPLDRAKPEGIRWAVIGPRDSIARMKRWVERIQHPVASEDKQIARPLFPGFETTFNTRWNPTPVFEIEISEQKLWQHAHNSDRHQRVYRTVDMYSSRILHALRTEDISADVWCIVIPEYIYQNCRPRSMIAPDLRIQPNVAISPGMARSFAEHGSLFPELNELAEEYLYEVNFHHQLKARLLQKQIPTQIVREIKVAHEELIDSQRRSAQLLKKQESAIAWNLSTAIFYKAGGRPWKLGAAREGVCYIGLVFKQDEREKDPRTACCAAQMFLDSGDGVVFKGAVGPWYRGKRGLFHLDHKSAKDVIRICVDSYKSRTAGKSPKELFIHGRIALDDEEWAGFQDGAGENVKVVGVRIRPVSSIKLFRMGDHPVLRGIAYIMDGRKRYLWTRGMIPRLRTYPGREVPNPLFVDVCRGQANIRTVMADILALTKLNYNSCIYADGMPVTLKFANAVGEILTAGPAKKLDVPPLPFKFYI
jgi:hypothetical protein